MATNHLNNLNHQNVPDFSCDIQKPITFLNFIIEHLGDNGNCDSGGFMTLDPLQIETFTWMLVESSAMIRAIDTALYGEKVTDKVTGIPE